MKIHRSVYAKYASSILLAITAASLSIVASGQSLGILHEQTLSSSHDSPPVISLPGNVELAENGSLEILANASLCSSCTASYFWKANGGSFQSLNSSGSRVVWSPPPGLAGAQHFDITATIEDGRGQIAFDSMRVRVSAGGTESVAISGEIYRDGTPVSGITITGGPETATTNSSGQYALDVPQGWSGTLTPSASSFSFSPPSRSYSNTASDKTNQSYSANRTVPRVTGRIVDDQGQPIEGVRMDGLPAVFWTDVNGDYSIAVGEGWSGTVEPSHVLYEFVPSERSFAHISESVTANFTGTAQTEVIAGSVTFNGAGLSGVTMNGLPGTPSTDSEGHYSATVPFQWSGTVTPAKQGFSLSPSSRSYDRVGMSRYEEAYTAVQQLLTITGSVSENGSGVSNVLLNGLPGGVTTDSEGNYQGLVPHGWSGTVTPFKHGKSFSPETRTYTNLGSNDSSEDYSAMTVSVPGGDLFIVSTSAELYNASSRAFSGDIILVRPGNYTQLNISGLRDGVILVSEAGPAQTTLELDHYVRFNGTDNIVDGFTFRNRSTSLEPVEIVGAENFQIRNCIIHANSSEYGIRINVSQNVLIENSTFLSGRGGILLQSGSSSGSLTIRNNRFTNLSSGAIVGSNDALDVVVENNIFEGSTTDGFEANSGLRSLQIKNNIFANNNYGLDLAGNPGAVVTNSVFYNNTRGVDLSNSAQVTFKNSIFVDNYRGIDTSSSSTVTVHHVMHWDNRSMWYDSGNWNWDWGTIWEQDPQFVNQEGGDFHLTSGSPARGRGEGGMDLGAYGGSRGDDWLIPPGLPSPPLLEGLELTGPTEAPSESEIELRADAIYSGGYETDVTGAATWSSSAPTALEPLDNGRFRAVAAGVATISANYGALDDSFVVTVSSASLSLGLSDSADPVAPGEPFTLTLEATNTGPAGASQVVLTTSLPADLDFVSASPAPDSGSNHWNLGDLGPGTTTTVVIAVRVSADAPDGAVLTSSAELSGSGIAAASASETTNVVGVPDLSVGLHADVTSVDPGGSIHYTLAYQNVGSGVATNVVVTEIFDPDLTFASSVPMPDSGSNVWNLGSLSPGASGTIEITTTVDPQAVGTIDNQATIFADQPDPTPQDNSSSMSTPLNAVIDLRLDLAGLPDEVLAAQVFDYVWSVTNLGPATATGVELQHSVPPGTSLLAVTPSRGSCSGTDPVTCSFGSLASGAAITLQVEARADSIGPKAMTATASASETDTHSGNNQAAGTLTIVPSVDLALTQESSADTIAPGDSVEFTLTVTNLGPSDSTGGQITDLLPEGLSFSSSDDSCFEAGGIVSCSFGSIAKNGSTQIGFAATSNLTFEGDLVNTATSEGNEADPDLSNNTANTSVIVEEPCFILTLDRVGSGSVPTSTASQEGCPLGQHQSGEILGLTASPAPGWIVQGWNGTDDNDSHATSNSATMPSSNHSITVTYVEEQAPCHALTSSFTGSGGVPSMEPRNSPDCPAAEFHPQTSIALSAEPAPGWTIGGWRGISDSAPLALKALLTMPDTTHLVEVDYVPCTAARALPFGYAVGVPAAVRIDVTPGASAVVYAVEETPPFGWDVSDIGQGGAYDENTQTIKWGPYFDNQARSLNYSATPPSSATEPGEFTGVMSVDGQGSLACGRNKLEPASVHPADMDDDWRMEINEITAYGASWKSGSLWSRPPAQIPIHFVTNAGFLWKVGEDYIPDPSQDPPWVPAVEAEAFHEEALEEVTASSTFDRPSYSPSRPTVVTIAVRPASDVQVYALEDKPPIGWSISSISDGGVFEEVHGLVKWGPFFDNLDRDLSYVAVPPMDETGVHHFVGQASFDGFGLPIGGDRQIDRECLFLVSPQSAHFSSIGGEASIEISTQEACSWEAASHTTWVTIHSADSGTGDGTIGISVEEHIGGTSRDGTLTIAGHLFQITQEGKGCFELIRTHSGMGSDPLAAPTNSTGCASGFYSAGEQISLTAVPNLGWTVSSWVGTDHDLSAEPTNTFTMQMGLHTILVNYVENESTILLVDDDDNSPDVRSYYTEAIEAARPDLEFDVWDTRNSDDEPGAQLLTEYDIVIWFTGAEVGGFAGPSPGSEDALGSFLDGGGCLFLSSQSYLFDRGGGGEDLPTVFMTDYLGLEAGVSDVRQSSITGAGPIFRDFGSYLLSPPFSNFSDNLWPSSGAITACVGDQGSTGISKNSGTYRTIFLGFPFEGLAQPDSRREAIGRVLEFCSRDLFSDGFESGDVLAWSSSN